MTEEIRVVLSNTKNPAEFSTELFQALSLDDSWEVALTEIVFSSNPVNFSKEDFITCKNFDTKVDKIVALDSDTIKSGKKLIEILNSKLSPIDGILFKFNEFSFKTTLELKPNRGVHFSKRLSSVLSLDETVENKSKTILVKISKYCTDIRLHFWNIYIYCNITKPIILGEQLYPLLQTLPVENFDENYLIKLFDPPMFIPLSSHFVPVIEIKICDELGRPLRFKSGCSTLCKLLFKRNS